MKFKAILTDYGVALLERRMYALLIFSLSHACQCGSLCLEHLQLRLLCSLVVIVIDVCAISVTVTCFETLCERETPRVPKHYAKFTYVKCSLLMIDLTSDQAESIEALGKYIWEEKLRVLELAITFHLARSFFSPYICISERRMGNSGCGGRFCTSI